MSLNTKKHLICVYMYLYVCTCMYMCTNRAHRTFSGESTSTDGQNHNRMREKNSKNMVKALACEMQFLSKFFVFAKLSLLWQKVKFVKSFPNFDNILKKFRKIKKFMISLQNGGWSLDAGEFFKMIA